MKVALVAAIVLIGIALADAQCSPAEALEAATCASMAVSTKVIQ